MSDQLDSNSFHLFIFENIKDGSVSAIVNSPHYLSEELIEKILVKGFNKLVRKDPEISVKMFIALAKALGDHSDYNIEIKYQSKSAKD